MEENEKRDINMVAMEVIMNAGDGRDKIDEALEIGRASCRERV